MRGKSLVILWLGYTTDIASLEPSDQPRLEDRQCYHDSISCALRPWAKFTTMNANLICRETDCDSKVQGASKMQTRGLTFSELESKLVGKNGQMTHSEFRKNVS